MVRSYPEPRLRKQTSGTPTSRTLVFDQSSIRTRMSRRPFSRSFIWNRGEPISGTEGLKVGLVQDLFEGDPAKAGEAFARKALAEKRPLTRVRDDDSKLAAAKANRQLFNDAAAAANRRNRGLVAPLACAECVAQTLEGTFDEGMAFERKKFIELMKPFGVLDLTRTGKVALARK